MFSRVGRGTLLAVLLVVAGIGCYSRVRFGGPDVPAADAVEVPSPEFQLCQRWMSLKNDGDPEAEKLLEPLPKLPVDPISEEQADRFNASYALHQANVRIKAIRPLAGPRFLVVTEGSISAPTLPVRSAKRVDNIQRALFNPSLVVEVSNGKIHPIRPQ